MSGRSGIAVTEWRRRTKARLVEHHGGKCVDCGLVAPPFLYEFDHRIPAEKEFRIGDGSSRSFERQLAESLKCDLVCPNCHRWRTHRQRCNGCPHC